MAANTNKANRLAAEARREHNRELASKLLEAGFAIFLTDEKIPTCKLWQHLDDDTTEEQRAAKLAEHVRKYGQPRRELFYGSTKKPETIERMFEIYPDAVPSICAGLNGLIVLDVDVKEDGSKDGIRKLQGWLKENNTPLPHTPTTATQSKGAHIYFKMPEGLPMGNQEGKLSDLDTNVRGRGGQVVAPGAKLASGKNYISLPNRPDLIEAFKDNAIPVLPDFIVQAIKTRKPSSVIDDQELIATMALMAEREGDQETCYAEFCETTGFDPKKHEDESSTDALAKVWRDGFEDGADHSKNRLALADQLRIAYLGKFTPVAWYGIAAHWEWAGVEVQSQAKSGEYDLRKLSRDWLKAFPIAADTESFDDVSAVKERTLIDDLRTAATSILNGEWDHDDGKTFVDELEATYHIATQTKDRLFDYLQTALDDVAIDAMDEARNALERAQDAVTKFNESSFEQAFLKLGAKHSSEFTVESLPVVDVLVEDIMTVGEIILSHGMAGASKTADKIKLGCCLAYGMPYHGKKTTRAGALLVLTEAPEENNRRKVAWDVANNVPINMRDTAPLVITSNPVMLIDGTNPMRVTDAEKNIIALARGFLRRYGYPCRYICIDNVRQVVYGGTANDEAVAAALMRALDRIKRATGATVDIITHPVKSDRDQYAGSGALLSMGDSMWKYSYKRETRVAEIGFDKLRLGDPSAKISYTLDFTSVSQSSQGKRMLTPIARNDVVEKVRRDLDVMVEAVANLPDPIAPSIEVEGMKEADAERAQALVGILAQQGALSKTELAGYYALTPAGRKVSLHPRTVQEIMAELVRTGIVMKSGQGKATRYGIAQAAKAQTPDDEDDAGST